MTLKYDFDVLPYSRDGRTNTIKDGGSSERYVIAKFRHAETAAAIAGADEVVRTYFAVSGFAEGTYDSGASEGCVPEESAHDVIAVCMSIKKNYSSYDLKSADWNGFDIRAFVQHIRDLKVEIIHEFEEADDFDDADDASADGTEIRPDAEPYLTPLERVQARYLNLHTTLGFDEERAKRVADAMNDLPQDVETPFATDFSAAERRVKARNHGITAFLFVAILIVGSGGYALNEVREAWFPANQESVSATAPTVRSDIVGGGARRITVER